MSGPGSGPIRRLRPAGEPGEWGGRGEWELDEGRAELRRRGEPVPLQPKPFQLLRYLVANPDRFVSKDELLAAVWPDVRVSDTAISTAIKGLRRVLGDDSASPAWIETRRSHGYRFIADVREIAPPAPDDAEPDPFVGREHVLERLASAHADSQRGRGRVVLLRGEAGIGKTRTLREHAEALRGAESPVLSAWCAEDGSGPPFWPWIQLLRRIEGEGELPDDDRFAAAWDDLLALRQIDPLPPGSDVTREARFRMFESAAHVLRAIAEPRGLVLAIDDLQGADGASLQLLGFVARELSDARVQLVCTLREPAASESELLGPTLGELVRLGHFVELRLTPLPPDAVAELVEAEIGDVAPATLARIAERARGNPFFARELARSVATAGTERGLDVPGAVQDAVAVRFERLPRATREALEVAAVYGREFTPGALARSCGGDAGGVRDALAAAVEDGFVREVAGGHRFEHELLREVIRSRLGVHRQAQLHLKVALALEALEEQGGSESRPEEVARHFAEAGSRDVAARAAAHSLRAAERAMEVLAFEVAAAHYRRARAALELAADPDPLLLVEILLGLARAGRHGGAPVEEVRRCLFEAADVARRRGDRDGVARAALGFEGFAGPYAQGDPEVLALLEEVVRARPDDEDALSVRVLARLGLELLREREWRAARARIDEACALAERVGDPSARGFALSARLAVAAVEETPEARLDTARELVRLGRETGDLQVEIAGRIRLFPLELESGAPDARGALADFARWVEERRLPETRLYLLSQQASLALLEGELDRADRLVEDGLRLAEQMQSPLGWDLMIGTQRIIRLQQGRFEGEERIVRASLARAYSLTAHFTLALVLLATGQPEASRREYERLIGEGPSTFPPTTDRAPTWAALTQLAHAFGDRERAAELFALLEDRRDGVIVGVGQCVGSTARYLGIAAHALGRLDEADRLLAQAIEDNGRIGALLFRAFAQHDRARVLLERGDPDGALALCDELEAFAEARGMKPMQLAARATRNAALGIPTLRGPRATAS